MAFKKHSRYGFFYNKLKDILRVRALLIPRAQHGPRCVPTSQYPTPAGTSEDCLFLDVYAPSSVEATTRLPVFVWIQGGGFNANSSPNYNGTGLIEAANMSMVVVTFNYRVGPYGFLSGSEVLEGGSVNNGLKDQIKVLKWVQEHISKVCGHSPSHSKSPLIATAVWRRSQSRCYRRRQRRRSVYHSPSFSLRWQGRRTIPRCRRRVPKLCSYVDRQSKPIRL